MCKSILPLVLGAILMGAPASAATILYDNLVPPVTGGSKLDEYVIAEDVVFVEPVHVTGLSFWANVPSGSPVTEIAWLVFADNAGYPGTQVAGGLSSMVLTPIDATPTHFRVDLTLDVQLTPGLYWFGLHAGPLALPPGSCDTGFAWLGSALNGTYLGRESHFSPDACAGVGDWDFTGWFTNDSSIEHALQVRGVAVPEPASIVLLTAAALGWASRRRRKP